MSPSVEITIRNPSRIFRYKYVSSKALSSSISFASSSPLLSRFCRCSLPCTTCPHLTVWLASAFLPAFPERVQERKWFYWLCYSLIFPHTGVSLVISFFSLVDNTDRFSIYGNYEQRMWWICDQLCMCLWVCALGVITYQGLPLKPTSLVTTVYLNKQMLVTVWNMLCLRKKNQLRISECSLFQYSYHIWISSPNL